MRHRHWKIDGEASATFGKRFDFDIAAMFANDRHANAEAQTRATAGALGGEKGIEKFGKSFGLDAGAIVGDGCKKRLAVLPTRILMWPEGRTSLMACSALLMRFKKT